MKHIVERRNQQGYDGEEFVKNLPELFKDGNSYLKEGHPGRYYIGHKNKEAVVRTDYNNKKRNWLTSAYYLEGAPSQDLAGFRTYDQTYANKQSFPLLDSQKSDNILPSLSNNLKPTDIEKACKPLSFNDWLKVLKTIYKNT